MAEIDTPDNTPPTPPRPKLAEAHARIADLEAKLAEYTRAEELEKARAEEAAKAKGSGAPPKLLGQIPVYDVDEPADVLARARAIRRGQIPIDRARRFRTESPIMVAKASPLAKRLGTHSPPIGTEFDRDEVSDADRLDLVNGGGIVAIA